MGLLIATTVVAAVLGLLAAVPVYWIVSIFGRTRSAQILAMTAGGLVFVVSFSPVFHWWVRATTTTVIGASSDVADQVMGFLKMPPGTATDFCYRRSVGGIPFVADFRMTEEDYLRWMQSQDWKPKRIAEDGTEVYPVRGLESGEMLRVRQGWDYHSQEPSDPDNTERYTFDAETSRVYVLLTL